MRSLFGATVANAFYISQMHQFLHQGFWHYIGRCMFTSLELVLLRHWSSCGWLWQEVNTLTQEATSSVCLASIGWRSACNDPNGGPKVIEVISCTMGIFCAVLALLGTSHCTSSTATQRLMTPCEVSGIPASTSLMPQPTHIHSFRVCTCVSEASIGNTSHLITRFGPR